MMKGRRWPEISAAELAAEFGLDRIELPQHYPSHEIHDRLGWLRHTLEDLREMLGEWCCTVWRRVRLTIAIKARHIHQVSTYRPWLRRIDLAWDSQGEMAFMFARILDHVLGQAILHASEAELTSVARSLQDFGPTHRSLAAVMSRIYQISHTERIQATAGTASANTLANLLALGYDPQRAPQEAFEQIVFFNRWQGLSWELYRQHAMDVIESIATVRREAVSIELDWTGSTNFFRFSRRRGRQFIQPNVLFATAFAAYIDDLMLELEITNPFLACGTRADDKLLDRTTGDTEHHYPSGLERSRINDAWPAFIEQARLEIESKR
jgi:hypothetical protein